MVLDDIQVGDNAHAGRLTEDILDLSFSLKDLMLEKRRTLAFHFKPEKYPWCISK